MTVTKAMPNTTMTKFGFPATLVADYDHWSVLLRPKQVTLGALVAVCKSPVVDFHRIGAAAFSELEIVTGEIEATLRGFVGYERINYLMLMMVDPDVHFHVVPRYSDPRPFAGTSFLDAGWPGPPELKTGIDTDATMRASLLDALRGAWQRQPGR